LLTERGLQSTHGAKHRRDVHPQQLRSPSQRAAAHQRKNQGQVWIVQSIVRRCIDHLE
jgi:hypothetical protein